MLFKPLASIHHLIERKKKKRNEGKQTSKDFDVGPGFRAIRGLFDSRANLTPTQPYRHLVPRVRLRSRKKRHVEREVYLGATMVKD